MPDMGASGFDGLGRLLVGGQVIESPPAPTLAPGTKVASDFFGLNPPTNPATQMVGLVNDAGGQVFNPKNPKWNESAPGKGDGGGKGDGQIFQDGQFPGAAANPNTAASYALDPTASTLVVGHTFKFAFTYLNANGETIGSPVDSVGIVTTAPNPSVAVTFGVIPAGVTSVKIYISDNGSSFHYSGFNPTTGTSVIVSSDAVGAALPTLNTTATTLGQWQSQSAVFTAADVGKTFVTPNAGATSSAGNFTHVTTFAAFIDAHNMTLTTPALSAVAGSEFAYFTDDRLAIQACGDAAEAAASVSKQWVTVLLAGGIFGASWSGTTEAIAGFQSVAPIFYGWNNVRVVFSGATLVNGRGYQAGGTIAVAFCMQNHTTHVPTKNFEFRGGAINGLNGGQTGNLNETNTGAIVGGNCSFFRIAEMEFLHEGGKPVLIVPQGAGGAKQFWFLNNHLHDCSSNVFNFGQATVGSVQDFLIEGNYAHDISQTWTGAEGFIIKGAIRFAVVNNRLINWGVLDLSPVSQQSTDGICAFNHVSTVSDISGGGLQSGLNSARMVIIGNIVDTTGTGASVDAIFNHGGSSTGIVIALNICKSGSTTTGSGVGWAGTGNAGIIIVANVFLGGAGAGRINFGGATGTFIVALNYMEGSMTAPPPGSIIVANILGDRINGTASTKQIVFLANILTVNLSTTALVLADQSSVTGNIIIQQGTGNCVGLFGVDSVVRANVLQRTQAGGTWINEAAGADYNLLDGNALIGSATFSLVGAHTKISGSPRFNPQGGVTTPGFPATTVSVQNTTNVDVLSIITNGTSAMTLVITGIKANVTISIPVSGQLTVPLPAGQSYTPTYAGGAPTHVWYGM